MKQILYFVKKQVSRFLMLAACGLTYTSCDSILDEEYTDEECAWEYRIKFKYDYNMKYADAFAREVKSVTLYAFDEDDNFVYQKTEQGDVLKDKDYEMVVELQAGDYHFVTWAGLENEESFSVPLMTPGESTLDDLTCRMNRETIARADDGSALIKDSLKYLFHGEVESASFSRGLNREQTVTVPLVKNTNSIIIMLQQYAEGLDVSNFEFMITDDNGLMNYDNTLLEDETLKYIPWETKTYDVIESEEESTINQISTVRAKMTVGRLIANKHPKLTINNRLTGETVLSIPLTDCLLLAKPDATMGDQEYLDRQDIYNMIFFLNDDMKWMNAEININGWVVRYNQMGF